MGASSILIVDDNNLMRTTLQSMLESEGYAVTSCEDGPSALKLAEERQFEVVLTDFQMPEMNGDEAVKALRRNRPDAFIIGFSVGNKKQAFLEAGADQFINKEQLPTALIPAIQRLQR